MIRRNSAGWRVGGLHGSQAQNVRWAALAIGKCPPITYYQLKTRLMAKVDVLASLNNKCVSNGRINAHKVIYDPAGPSAPGNLGAVPTGWTTIRLTWTDNSTNEIGFEAQRKAPGMPDHVYR